MSLSFFNKLIKKQDVSGLASHHLHEFFKTKIQSGDYEIIRKTPNNIHFCGICGDKITGKKEIRFYYGQGGREVYLHISCAVKLRMA